MKIVLNENDRYDLSGLSITSKHISQDFIKVIKPAQQFLNIDGNKLIHFCNTEKVSVSSILLFAVHKILRIYGNCTETELKVYFMKRGVEQNEEDDLHYTISHVNHKKQNHLNVIESVKEIEHYLHNEGILNEFFNIEKKNSMSGNERLTHLIEFILSYNNQLSFHIDYDANVFDYHRIADVLTIIQEIILQIVSNPLTIVSDLNFLSNQQIEILDKWNRTEFPTPIEKTIHQIFEEQVVKSEEKISVIFHHKKLTYKELNKQSNKLAHYLVNVHKAKADSFIALFLDRNEKLVVSILAVLKSGAAYVPIDPSYNIKRIRFILEDTNASVILTNKIHKKKLSDLLNNQNQKILIIDDEDDNIFLNYSNENPVTPTTSSNLCYAIYTSGTTGKPKGVLVEHKGVVNFIADVTRRYNCKGDESVLLFFNYVFDASVEQLLFALLNSHSLVIMESNFWMHEKQFYKYLNETKVTHVNATPTFLNQYNLSKLKHLKRLCISAEAYNRKFFEKVTKEFKGPIFDGYGPTEVTIGSFVNLAKSEKENIFSIGALVSNLKCYLVDYNNKRVPIGAKGEVYLGGIGVTRGYLHRDEITKEKFIQNIYQTEHEKLESKNQTLYKTGDIMRWLSDTELEYIGRNDHQIKIRGFRVELEEIEGAFLSYPGIKFCVVLPKENPKTKNKFLVAFYMTDKHVDDSLLKVYLKEHLPIFMIPSKLIKMDHLPITINSKLNVHDLSEIDIYKFNERIKPRNGLDDRLCQIWSDVLGLDKELIGITDEFYALGGSSIQVTEVLNKIQKIFGISIKAQDIINKNIIDISDSLRCRSKTHETNIVVNDLSQLCSLNGFDLYEIINEHINNHEDFVFIFPPKDGGAESYYNNIVPMLTNKKLILFNNIYKFLENCNEDLSHLEVSYEKLAEYYIKLIKSIQPEGSYNFVGWSFGGVLAYEISRQLTKEGETIRRLLIIDSYFYYKDMVSTDLFSSEYDKINLKYTPVREETISNIESIVLFKATKPVDIDDSLFSQMSKSEKTTIKELSSCYCKTTANCLDFYLPSQKKLEIVLLNEVDHFSWIYNKEEISIICNSLM